MVKIYQKTIKGNELKTLENFKADSWIYVNNPIQEELEYLENQFSLDRSLLKDILDPYEGSRMEIEKKLTYIFIRVPYKNGEGRISTTPLLIVIGEDFLITVSQIHLLFLEKFISGERNLSTTQKTKLLLQIFSEMDFAYNKFLIDINKRIRGISVKIENISNKNIIQFVTFEEVLNDFISALVPTSTILKNLLSKKFLNLPNVEEGIIEDLLLSNHQLIRICNSNLKNIMNIRGAYSTIMTNNLNKVVNLLTIFTIILAVPTMVASFYGMNIPLPFAHHPLVFGGVVGLSGIISGILIVIFIRKGWL